MMPIALVAGLLALNGCGTPGSLPPSEPRIFALSPSLVTTLDRLGAAESLVGVDCSPVMVTGMAGPTCVSAISDNAVAAIVALQPALVLIQQDTLYHDIVPQLRARNVEVFLAAPHSTLDVFDVFRRLGAAIGRPAAGDLLVDQVMRELAYISVAVLHRKRPTVALVLGRDPITVLAGDSYANDLVEIPGGNTVLEDIVGPALSLMPVELAMRAPDVIIDASRECWDRLRRTAALAYWQQIAPASRIEFLPRRVTRLWGDLPGGAKTIQGLLFPDLAGKDRERDSDRPCADETSESQAPGRKQQGHPKQHGQTTRTSTIRSAK